MRASSVRTLYAGCLNKRTCNFLLLHGSAFAVDFAILWSHGIVKVLFFCSFTKLCMWWSHFWDRVWVHFLSFLYQGCRKRNVLVSMNFCGLWRPDGQLGRPFGAKPVLRRFSGPRIGPLEQAVLQMILFLVGASGVHIGCCLNPLEVSFLLFRCVWWLDCLPLKEGPSAFCSP